MSDFEEEETRTPSTVEEPKSAPAPAGGLGRREMMIIVAALIGSGALVIGMLTMRGAATAAPVPAREAASSVTPPEASSPVAVNRTPDVPLAPSAGWVENSETWTARARRSIAFELAARNDVQVWMQVVRPLLVVRCLQGRTDAFVFTGSAAAMEAQDEDHTVRISFDGDAERTERWPDSSAHDALFAPDGARFLADLLNAQTLRFGFTPHNSASVVAQFDVAGLGDRIGKASACRGN